MDMREKVINKLKEVIDPGTLADVVSMGLIKNLAITNYGKVSLDFHPSSPVCPLAIPLALRIQDALVNVSGVRELCITVTGHKMADEINNYLKMECE